MNPSLIEYVATALFALALLHTFSAKHFERLAQAQPAHAGFWHLMGEVEVVFGLWAMVFVAAFFAVQGSESAIRYLEERNFTEPLFVFAIMVVAGSRPVLEMTTALVALTARLLPVPNAAAGYFCALAIVPLLGSFITEPGAMTLAALMLRERYFRNELPASFKYATVGVLFVNISIGGVLTPYAAPPVLMVANTWGWDLGFMLSQFGWKAAIAVFLNAAIVSLRFRRVLAGLPSVAAERRESVPWPVTAVSLLLLVGIVFFSHHPVLFLGLFLFFLGFAHAYRIHHGRLILREALLVAFFLAGLVVLGGLQRWWLQPLLGALSEREVFYAATALTAITDNAALTYLGSLVDGLDPDYQYALVAGAVTGGGLTVIANAPNPAGYSILRGRFDNNVIQPGRLLLEALLPTLTAIVAFRLL